MRKSTLFFLALALGGAAFPLQVAVEGMRGAAIEARLAAERDLVRTLGLTDFCLFTEARFTRHLSLADLHAPFQDSPGARDLFPSGSLTPPPRPSPEN